MSYPGGKAGPGIYQTLINQIPPHDCYVAPFLGHDAVMLHKRPAAQNIGVDLNPIVLGWWQTKQIPRLTLFRTDGIEWLRYTFGCYQFGTTTQESAAVPAGSEACAAEIGGDNSRRRWFVYCDPPYPLCTRKGGRIYRHEMTDCDHKFLLATLIALPVNVMLSTYPNDLYDGYLRHLPNWRLIEYFSIDRRGNRRLEQLWMNYPEPLELHDYRFTGLNKRQRERIRRRARNCVDSLRRMKPHERAAVLQAIEENYRLPTPHNSATRARDAEIGGR